MQNDLNNGDWAVFRYIQIGLNWSHFRLYNKYSNNYVQSVSFFENFQTRIRGHILATFNISAKYAQN